MIMGGGRENDFKFRKKISYVAENSALANDDAEVIEKNKLVFTPSRRVGRREIYTYTTEFRFAVLKYNVPPE